MGAHELVGLGKSVLSSVYHALATNGLLPSFAAQPFVVVAGPRTGSTLLQTLINSHPNAICMHELFREKAGTPAFYRHYLGSREELLKVREDDIARFLGKVLLAPQPPWIKAIGFKALYVQPSGSTRKQAWQALSAIPRLKVIVLERNEVHSVISFCIARETKKWVGKKFYGSVRVDVDYVLRRLAFEKECRRCALALLKNHKMLKIKYEDMISDFDLTGERVSSFLSLPARKLNSPLVRQTQKPLSEVVENYHELITVLSETEWASKLRDEQG